MMETTIDGILNKRLCIEQPKEGFRIAVDTVFLAASVPAKPNETVLDMGCGVGGAMLALARRVSDLLIKGVDLQPDLIELCRANILRNSVSGDLSCEVASVARLDAAYARSFDHVMINPPYLDPAKHDVSPNHIKRVADAEGDIALADWISAARAALTDRGVLTMIHRFDRKDELVMVLSKHFAGYSIKPLVSKEGGLCKRILVRACVSSCEKRECAPLVLHEENGKYTSAAESVLRDASAVLF